MEILDTIIVLAAAFLGTGMVIRLVKEYIAIGKREKENEKNTRNNSDAGRK